MTHALAHRLRDERGFTLIEMLTTLAILGLLFATFAIVMSTTITQGTQEQAATEIQNDARAAMERFAQEMRQAHSGDGSWPIQTVSTGTQTIRFVSPDKLQPYHMRTIEWRLSSGNFDRRSVTSTDTDGYPWTYATPITSATWITQARSIRNTTIFQFLDASDATTTNPLNVRKVEVTLDVSTTGQGTRIYRFQTSVTPRVTPPS